MCGRYTIKAPVEAIEAELSLSEHLSGDFEPRYNITSLQVAHVKDKELGFAVAGLAGGGT